MRGASGSRRSRADSLFPNAGLAFDKGQAIFLNLGTVTAENNFGSTDNSLANLKSGATVPLQLPYYLCGRLSPELWQSFRADLIQFLADDLKDVKNVDPLLGCVILFAPPLCPLVCMYYFQQARAARIKIQTRIQANFIDKWNPQLNNSMAFQFNDFIFGNQSSDHCYGLNLVFFKDRLPPGLPTLPGNQYAALNGMRFQQRMADTNAMMAQANAMMQQPNAMMQQPQVQQMGHQVAPALPPIPQQQVQMAPAAQFQGHQVAPALPLT